MQLVTSGGRLEAPPGCPGPAYRIMVHCWHTNPEERPTFVTVLERIGYCIQDPDVLAMPLPVSQRPLSAERDTTATIPISTERDTTAVRPASGVDECLRVLRPSSSSGVAGSAPSFASDYLVPLNAPAGTAGDGVGGPSAAGSRQEHSGYWETSFTREGVKAIARGQLPPTPLGGVTRSGSGSLALSQSQSAQPLLGEGPAPTEDDGEDEQAENEEEEEDSSANSLKALDASLL